MLLVGLAMVMYRVVFILDLELSMGGLVFFFNDTATTEIYTLSLHDALPISDSSPAVATRYRRATCASTQPWAERSEEHTSELQSHSDLVCHLLLEKKKTICGLTDNGSQRERTRPGSKLGNPRAATPRIVTGP